MAISRTRAEEEAEVAWRRAEPLVPGMNKALKGEREERAQVRQSDALLVIGSELRLLRLLLEERLTQ